MFALPSQPFPPGQMGNLQAGQGLQPPCCLRASLSLQHRGCRQHGLVQVAPGLRALQHHGCRQRGLAQVAPGLRALQHHGCWQQGLVQVAPGPCALMHHGCWLGTLHDLQLILAWQGAPGKRQRHLPVSQCLTPGPCSWSALLKPKPKAGNSMCMPWCGCACRTGVHGCTPSHDESDLGIFACDCIAPTTMFCFVQPKVELMQLLNFCH